MKVNDKMTKPMDMEFMFMLMVLNIKDNDNLINSMEKVQNKDQMVLNIKDIQMVLKMVMENFNELIVQYLKDNLKII